MGKLGSRELTAGSDVDMILLYDHAADADESNGAKPLASSQYYARLTQRLIAAVSAPTAEGVLYEIDLRLRPSGNKGPVATHVEAFRKYQQTEAWTWEHMALTRARVIADDDGLAGEVAEEIADIIAARHDPAKVRHDACEMRELIETDKPPRDIWDLKLIPGGLIDLEFIVQTAALLGQVEGKSRTTSTAEMLSRLSGRFCTPQARDELSGAYRLFMGLAQVSRLCLTGSIDRDDMPPGLADLLLRNTDLPDLKVLEAHIEETAQQVRAHFDRLVCGR